MSLADLVGIARSVVSGARVLLGSADLAGALNFVAMTALRSRTPIRVKIRSIPVFIRPCTSDLDIARTCFSGEFDAAIAAAKPLRYNFVIDAGGHIGGAAIMLARAFPDATIISLEPSRENFTTLAINARAYPNIVALNMALGSTKGLIELVDRGTGEVGYSIVQAPADWASPCRLHEVAVTTVPVLMKTFGASGIDFLKLDIEGAELDVLTGSLPWLPATRVVFAELHERIVRGCEAIFTAATSGRSNSRDGGGEKVLSIRLD